jgi:DNA-binding LacI/PurR family transcriptional regulator
MDLMLKKEKVYLEISKRINSGIYKSGEKLPVEKTFCKEFNVSIITLRNALKRLENENVIVRIPSKGTFVNKQDCNSERTICVISESLADIANPSLYILPSIQSEAELLGYKLEVLEKEFIENTPINIFKNILTEKAVKGIILLTSSFNGDERILQQLRSLNLPICIPHAEEDDYKVTGFSVTFSNPKSAWLKAIKHISESGHTDVATIYISPENIRGFTTNEHLALLKKYGMNPSKELLLYLDYDVNTLESSILNFLNKCHKTPTAFLCTSDFLAIYVYEALKKQGLRIPEDVAVQGYCGYPGGAFLSPPLSTINLQYEKIGRVSVNIIDQRNKWFNRNVNPPKIEIKHFLVKRESTGLGRIEKNIIADIA